MSKHIVISLTKEAERENAPTARYDFSYDEIFLDRYNGISCANTAFLIDHCEDCQIVTMVPAHKIPISTIPDIIISFALAKKFMLQGANCESWHNFDGKAHFFHIKLPFQIDFDRLKDVCQLACKYLCPNADINISITVQQRYFPSQLDVLHEKYQETEIEITIYENAVSNN